MQPQTVASRRNLALLIGLVLLLLPACAKPWVDRTGAKTSAVTEDKQKACGEGPSYVVLTFEGAKYIENGKGGFPRDHLVTPYQEHSTLPDDAKFTGFSSGSRQLWVSASNPDVVYLVDGSNTASVPKGDFRWGCL